MPALADLQTHMRAAVVADGGESLAPLLRGGAEPLKRLAIHRRHYQASLVAALIQKFPATVWFAGTDAVAAAARAFVHASPPAAPCIAEYGEGFPAALAQAVGGDLAAWVEPLARLDLRLGHVSIAIDYPALTMNAFAAIDPAVLPDLALDMQPGLAYLTADRPVDRLAEAFLADATPEVDELVARPISIEIQGARGAFSLRRLEAGEFGFRSALWAGETVAIASGRALEANAAFDVAAAFQAVVADKLVTGIRGPHVV